MLPQALRLLSERNRRRCGVVLRLMWSPCGTHAARRAGSRRLCSRVAPARQTCSAFGSASAPRIEGTRAQAFQDVRFYEPAAADCCRVLLSTKKIASHSEIRCITASRVKKAARYSSCATALHLCHSSGVNRSGIAAKLLHTVTFFRDVRPRPRKQ